MAVPKIVILSDGTGNAASVFGGPMSGEFSNRLISAVMSKPQSMTMALGLRPFCHWQFLEAPLVMD